MSVEVTILLDGGYLLCLLCLVLGCDLLPFLVAVSGVLFWALLLVDVKGFLFLRTLIKRGCCFAMCVLGLL